MDLPPRISLIEWKKPYKVSLLSPAKLNLYLNIVGKYPGGYHRIQTVMARISLFDRLIIEKSKETKVICNDKSLERNNICLKVVNLLKKKLRIKEDFLIILEKKIPPGTGLGGASSNAALTLLGISELLSLRLKERELFALGSRIGSDVNFFLAQTPFALVEGRGEKVTPWRFFWDLEYFVVCPRISVSTSLIYKELRIKGKLTKSFSNVNIILHALKNKDHALLKEGLFNILEKTTFTCFPNLEKKAHILKKLGFVMSGSGSAFFQVIERKNKINTEFFKKDFLTFRVKSF